MKTLDINKIVSEVKNYGCYKIEGFLNKEEILKAREIASNNKKGYSAKSGILSHNFGLKKKDQYVPHTFKSLLIKFIKLDFKKLNQGLFAIKIFQRRPQLKEICNRIFEKKNKLSFIDGYMINNNEKIIWHTDKMMSKNLNDNKLIFFVYLDDVDEKSGSMGYIKGSHKIIYHLKKGLISKKLSITSSRDDNKLPLDGANFSIPFLKSLVEDKINYNYLIQSLNNKFKVDYFLEKLQIIIDNKKETNEFFFKMNKGDAIVFDQSGIHGGSEVANNQRSVLRFAFNKI